MYEYFTEVSCGRHAFFMLDAFWVAICADELCPSSAAKVFYANISDVQILHGSCISEPFISFHSVLCHFKILAGLQAFV